MVKYVKTNTTAKKGINFVREIVDGAGCIFHEIVQNNDLGIDAFIEFFRDENPLNRLVAVQVKSGDSYFSETKKECYIPIKQHREYWSKHPLPVMGIVYLPTLEIAYWIDIKRFLKIYPSASRIRFTISEVNRFDFEAFKGLFVPIMLRELPNVDLQRAISLFRSTKQDESFLGMEVLFGNHINMKETWEEFISYFMSKEYESIHTPLVYYLSHIPWHSDIGYTGEKITMEIKEIALKLMLRFRKEEVLKLLRFIDPEDSIRRGVIGQSVEAIISSLPLADYYLLAIANDILLEDSVRESAALIYAMHLGREAQSELRKIAESGLTYVTEINNYIDQYGHIDPYG